MNGEHRGCGGERKRSVGGLGRGLVFVLAAGPAGAQQPASVAAPLVFDRVTVVDVEHGTLLQGQRVVITGSRITAMRPAGQVKLPTGARVVDARGKYLIPGLWDVHAHPMENIDVAYPLFIATGVTGIRDPGSPVPLDTLRWWRQEILAGRRVGPVRQILSGQSIGGPTPNCRRTPADGPETCVADAADAVRYVDSLKAAGADMIKPRAVTRVLYFVIAAEARRMGIPFGGHAGQETAIEAADSGAAIIDHPQVLMGAQGIKALCMDPQSASVASCQPVADRLRRNGTWFVPTLWVYGGYRAGPKIIAHYSAAVERFWTDATRAQNWFHPAGAIPNDTVADTAAARVARMTANIEHMYDRPVLRDPLSGEELGVMSIPQRVGLPILAGTDVTHDSGERPNHLPRIKYIDNRNWGISLHAELAMLVAEGLTPLAALQSATLNPAKMWHATDSLGTVAAGKLADLVLLDANPLEDITNTTTIRAVVADGRYFGRAALDSLVAAVRAQADAVPAAAP